ncbi:4Fe-4S binding protein [Maridesulfovibrio sp.]|uniref:4Fe-4S binding protein n=1 Tax=Maridesulfovibrio sp. TaxID=2795000 RepID=UPI003B00A520
MKLYKKDTPLTLSRDAIRLFFAANFYFMAKIMGIDFELESEYIVLGSILLFGPFFCGWACPFGSASYFATRIGNKLFPKLQFNIPQPYDSWLRMIRYPLLVFFLYLFVIKGVSYFGDHIEMYKSTAFSWNYIQAKHLAVLLVPFFIPNFFCKYMCFQKAGYNLTNKAFKILKIKRNSETCISCGKCDRVCPMQANPSGKTEICGGDCLNCFNCLDNVCPPKADALSLEFLGFKVKPGIFAALAMAVYLTATYLVLFVYQW